MRDVSEILTEKNYGHKVLKSNSRARERLAKSGALDFSYPKWLPAIFIMIIAISALGEDKVLNQRFVGLPKAITILVLVMAFFMLVLRGEIRRFRVIGGTALLYILYWAALSLWSAVLWIINFSDNSVITRGVEKMIFQTIAVLVAIAAVFIFGSRAIDYFAIGAYIGNGMIAIMEIPSYGGPAACFQDIFTLITTFGNGQGYALAMEIHELTFLFGMFLVYYFVFAPRNTPQQKRNNRRHIVLSTVFLLLGFKRALVLLVPLVSLAAWFIRKRKNPFKITMCIGVIWVVFYTFYLYAVYTGAAKQFAENAGIDMMGRDFLWTLAKRYYTFSPLYMGQGFGSVDNVIVAELYEAGLINKGYPLHNDVLKVFIEFGFPGYLLWSGAQFILFPLLFKKFFDTDTAVLYMSTMSLMAATYMTDNTAFYFWCMMGLRLIPLAYGVLRKNLQTTGIKEEKARWEPPGQGDFQQLVRERMAQNGGSE